MSELLVRDARLLDGSVVDIRIKDGRIVEMGGGLTGASERELPVGGRLVTSALVNPHIHLDKALTITDEGAAWPEGTFEESIEMTLRLRESYTHDDLVARGSTVLEQAVVSGTTAVRVFGDVGSVGGLLPVAALLTLKERFSQLLDIQVVAFPQEGLLREPGGRELMVQAMELGCDVVGAFPWYELSGVYAEEHLEIAFEVARQFDADLHAFVDDEPVAPHTRDLESLARATIRHGWHGRVSASHACGLASYDDHLADKTIRLVAEAGISILSNAHISLVTKCQHAREPKPRGITRVRELIAHGVNVATGQDDIADPYYPFGRGDMLEVAGYLAHVAHLHRPSDVKLAIDAITKNAAKAMRLTDYGLDVGCWADLVVFEEGISATDLIRLQPPRRWVLKRGQVVAETTVVREFVGSSTTVH